MNFTNIKSVFNKQVKETLKNKEVLIQFIMFPILAVVMDKSVNLEGMPAHYFINLFATMYIGMAPLLAMASIMAEEKEKNTLRVLLMANVKPQEYLIGIGIYIFLLCMAGSAVFAVSAGYTGMVCVKFMTAMAVGILCATMIGAAIGTFSRNQMMATSIAVPLMLLFSILPMIAVFNESIGKFSDFTYSRRIMLILEQVEKSSINFDGSWVILVNAVIAIVCFVVAYNRSGFEA